VLIARSPRVFTAWIASGSFILLVKEYEHTPSFTPAELAADLPPASAAADPRNGDGKIQVHGVSLPWNLSIQ